MNVKLVKNLQGNNSVLLLFSSGLPLGGLGKHRVTSFY